MLPLSPPMLCSLLLKTLQKKEATRLLIFDPTTRKHETSRGFRRKQCRKQTWQISQRGASVGAMSGTRWCLLASLLAACTLVSQSVHNAASSAQQMTVAFVLSHTSHWIFIERATQPFFTFSLSLRIRNPSPCTGIRNRKTAQLLFQGKNFPLKNRSQQHDQAPIEIQRKQNSKVGSLTKALVCKAPRSSDLLCFDSPKNALSRAHKTTAERGTHETFEWSSCS